MSGRMMWDGQSDLRWSMERLADEALDRAGIELDPRGFLIGIPEDDPDLPVVIEPSRRAFELDGLASVLTVAQRRFDRLPEAAGDELAGTDHYSAARLEGCRRDAATKALAKAARFEDRELCVGLSVRVGGYRVFPVLAVRSGPWLDANRLRRNQIDGLPLDESFPEAIVNDVLRAASRELDRVSPTTLMGIDAGAILRSAADSFVNGIVARTGQEFAGGLRDALDAVSAQTYEGRASLGGIVLAPREHPAVSVDILFEHVTPVAVPRLFRKVLEMSGAGLRLLTDGREVYGLGSLEPSYKTSTEECFLIDVVGNGAWELWHGDAPLLRVDHGQPSLPTDLMDPGTFEDTVRRVFGTDAAPDKLWQLAQVCARQQHGTMLVVHPDAGAEGNRLLPQAFTIEPTMLGERAFHTLTKIDGAVLVGPDGTAHAIGVILDGAATGTGDGARGARYNSAIRYLAGAGKGSMVIIVSGDGRIDLLPKLMRRVRRETVQTAVDRFVEAVAEEEHYEKLARLDARCASYVFYMTADQCDVVNAARERVEERRWVEERVRLQVVPVQPHPAMDDSYFVES